MATDKAVDRRKLEGFNDCWSLEQKFAHLFGRFQALEVLVDIALKDEWPTPACWRQLDRAGR